jgi:hypothetical protein
MCWLRHRVLTVDARHALENWVRLRFQLAGSDPITAIIGAVGRLTDAGMTADEAVEAVLRIMHETDQGAQQVRALPDDSTH